MSEVPDDIKIAISLREILADIQKDVSKGFARIEVSMSGKADKVDVARMEARLDAHGKALDEHRADIAELKIQAREEESARTVAAKTNAWWHSRLAKVGGFLLGTALAVAAVIAIIQGIQSLTG